MRPDGRADNQLRPVTISPGFQKYPAASVLITVGDTRVSCAATVAEEVPPWRKKSGQGWVTAEYSMLPGATLERSPREAARGRLTGRTQEIQRLIGRSLRAVTDLAVLGPRTITIDCDVIQADGGTRTAAITGACVALARAAVALRAKGLITGNPLTGLVAATSVGIVDGRPLLDLCYTEDSVAEVDLNLVQTEAGGMVEIQGTAEHRPFDRDQLDRLLELAGGGLKELFAIQKNILADPAWK